jgi:PAS domain S-box-containing protein
VFTRHGAQDGQLRYWGIASVVAYVDSILSAGDFPAASAIRIALRGKDGHGANGDLIDGDPAIFEAHPVLMDVQIPGGSWQLGAVPAAGWQASMLHRSQYFQSGLAITLLIAAIVGLRAANRRQAEMRNAALELEIQERRKAEDALRDEERRFRILFESSPDPAWIIEGSRFVECNAAARILLRKRHQMLPSIGAAVAGVPTDGEPSFAGPSRNRRAAACSASVDAYARRRLRFPAGDLVAAGFAGAGGHLLRLARHHRTQDEERLKLAATVLASTAEGVMITDVHGVIVSVNRAFTEITGYAEDEVLGLNPRVLKSERQGAEFYQTLWDALTQGDVWQGEIWNRRKNGEPYPEWLTISAIRTGKGVVTHYVGVFSDISSIKRSQDALERLAHFDPLTDLPNRVLFQDRLAHAIDRAQRYQHGIAVLLLDLDGFKTVNDSLGHPVGDLRCCKGWRCA